MSYSLNIKKSNIELIISFIQILLLISYLGINIINTGSAGTALPLLAGFVVLSLVLVATQASQGRITVAMHFFVFLLFVAWLSFRVVVDLNSFYHLVQVTIATTGGVLLFFLIGTSVRKAINLVLHSDKVIRTILLYSLLLTVLIFISFKARLIRTDIFYISGVDGGYQRPGNFLIMFFILFSYLYTSYASLSKNKLSFMFWLMVYSFTSVLLLVESQMIGSNAATINILAMFLMSLVLSLLAFNKKFREKYVAGKLKLPKSKLFFDGLLKKSILITALILFVSITAIFTLNINLSKTRVFGFGSGSNISILSRFEIIINSGIEQMGYATWFGNVNVTYLTTGEAGRTLHNFIPNVLAELGAVGLFIVFILFVLILKKIYKNIQLQSNSFLGFRNSILNSWFLFVFIWLIFYINNAVGKEWSVIWFFIGFCFDAFSLKNKVDLSYER